MQARSSASITVPAATPRSKRPLLSVRMPKARLVRRMAVRSNAAHSNITSVVPSVISLSSPPMMPARPVARSWSQMTRSSVRRARSFPSSVVSVSPGWARRTTICRPRTLLRSKACMGWPYSIMM